VAAVTDALAGYCARIQTDFPTLPIRTVRLNRDGLMNAVVIVNDAMVFRFATNEHAQQVLAYEARLLPIISRFVTLPVPHIEHATASYLHYRLVPGSPCYRHTLLRADAITQDQLAHQLATFLYQLHTIPLHAVPIPPWPVTPDSASRRILYEQRYAALQQDVYPLLWADQRAWIADLFAPVQDGRIDLDAFTPVVIHRDLAAYHILHDPQTTQLTGVIDFGTGCVSHSGRQRAPRSGSGKRHSGGTDVRPQRVRGSRVIHRHMRLA